MIKMGQNTVIAEIRQKFPTGAVSGRIIVDGEYTTLSEETEYGNFHIPFTLSADDELDMDFRITFNNESGGFDVSEEAEELLNAGFNWWIEE